MSRFKVLAANPRRSLAALATVLVAVGVTGASGANFSAQTANPSNTFTAGTLSMSNSKNNAAILTAANLRPGVAGTVGTVDITNTGSLAAPFTLDKGTVTDSDPTYQMSTKLNLVIMDCGTDLDCTTGTSTSVYSGTLAAMGTGIALGTFNAGVGHRYEFTPTLDSTATNNFQGKSATAQFLWNAS
jgi:spore coat-associated protein N